MNLLANGFTSLNLAIGFCAIIFSLQNNIILASWCVIICAVLDGLDGFIARASVKENEFGKNLDSLVDAVSFGAAPAIMGCIFLYRKYNTLAATVFLIYLFCGLLRLARYNTTAKEKLADYFLGLPITMAGSSIAAFILWREKYYKLVNREVLLFLALILAFLMISRIKYLNLKGLVRALGKKKAVVAILFLAGLIFSPQSALVIAFLAYLAFAPALSH